MARTVLIDEPGAGKWIMDRCEGVFNELLDHSFSSHDGDRILGGIVLGQYLGASMLAHMAGEGKHWCSRELLWLVFDYAFNQLGCIKVLGAVRSDNHRAISVDLRGGWHLETVINDLYAPGVHMMVLTMTKARCPWLNYQPKEWRANYRRTA